MALIVFLFSFIIIISLADNGKTVSFFSGILKGKISDSIDGMKKLTLLLQNGNKIDMITGSMDDFPLENHFSNKVLPAQLNQSKEKLADLGKFSKPIFVVPAPSTAYQYSPPTSVRTDRRLSGPAPPSPTSIGTPNAGPTNSGPTVLYSSLSPTVVPTIASKYLSFKPT